jgi:hypothetical protein
MFEEVMTMGDRAYVRITCRREDAARFEQLGFVDEETAKNGCAVAMVEEAANYAHYSTLTEVAKDRIVFFGWHDPGCEYDGSMFASDGAGEYCEMLSKPRESLALVRIRPDDHIADSDLDRARKHYAALSKARAELGLEAGASE